MTADALSSPDSSFTDHLRPSRSNHLRSDGFSTPEWEKYLEQFEDIDLRERPSTGLEALTFRMSTDDNLPSMTDSVITNDDFEHVDHPEEEIVADETRPPITAQDHLDDSALATSMFEFDSISEGGETVETVSACGQSDAETIASVNSDSDEAQEAQSGRLQFPDPLPAPAAHSPPVTERIVPALPKSLLVKLKYAEAPRVDDEDEWAAVRSSEVTIKGEDKEWPMPPSSSEASRLLESKPALVSTDANIKVESKPALKKEVKTRVAALIPGSLRSRSAMAIWAIGILALAIQGAVFLFFGGWNSADPYTESVQRYNDLKMALVSRGFVEDANADNLASNVLIYPKVSCSDEGYRLGFPSEIYVKFAEHGQLFVSLPRGHRGRYSRSPDIDLRNAKCGTQEKDCNVPVLEQLDLIDGATYARLDMPNDLVFFEVAVRSQHHSTVVSFKYLKDRPHQHYQLLSVNKVKDAMSRGLEDMIKSAKSATDSVEQSLLFLLDRSIHAKEDILDGLSKPVSELHANARLLFSDSSRRAHQFAEAARLNWGNNRAEMRSMAISQIEKLDIASKKALSKLELASKHVEATLARAQKNGLGIAHRVANIFQSEGIPT